MVDFTTDFDTRKQSHACEAMVQNLPKTVLKMVEKTKGGEEQAVGMSVADGKWRATDLESGTESEISGDIIQDLWLEAQTLLDNRNITTSQTHIVHTHPSGLAGMSFNDVLSAIQGIKKAAPITGNFVLTENKGNVKINGLTLKDKFIVMLDERQEMEEFKKLKRVESRVKNPVERGIMSPDDGVARLMDPLQDVFDTCSYAIEIQALRSRALQDG